MSRRWPASWPRRRRNRPLRSRMPSCASKRRSRRPTAWRALPSRPPPGRETPAPAVIEALDPDDLTRLTGIGPKLSAALAERGVTRFAQIAEWTADDLAELDAALSLKGRAVREAWVAQAKRLAGS